MRSIACALGLGATMAALVGPVAAHHGWSGYDSSKEMLWTGAINCGRLLAYF